MERERLRLEELETENCNLEQRLEACSSADHHKELMTRYQRNKELLDSQRKLFDDLEFQQLEVIITVKPALSGYSKKKIKNCFS